MSGIKTATITVARIAYWSVGVRLWFVVQSTDGTRFQRWSLSMDSSDECLLIAKPGDALDVSYIEQEVDPQGNMQKNVIDTVEFK